MAIPNGSLARRLILSLTLANALILVLAASMYLWRGYGSNASEVISHLKERAREVAVLGIVPAGEQAAVFDAASGAAAPGSDSEIVAHLPQALGRGLTDGVLVFSGADTPHVIAVSRFEVDGRTVIGAVLHRGPLTAELWEWLGHELASDVLPIFVPLFVVNLVVTVLTVRRTMEPVVALSRQARHMGPSTLDIRLGENGVPAEIAPLVRAVNAALDRVEAGFTSQRRFTANAAHELRTPLAVLKARLEQVGDIDLRRQLVGDTERMARVVDQLLTVARMEARGLEMTEPVALVPLAEQVVADLFPLAQRAGKGISLEADGEPALPLGNADGLRDALRNLVENAVRMSPDGGCVEVVLDRDATIRVLDQGPGVPESQHEAIFEPFNRGPGSRGGSAGLGLSIARSVVRLHGGDIAVRTRPGGGAEFAMVFARQARA
ncbi:MAG TPA: ATP-binding protein [Candidatus Omnitrophota bacterium]|nr:ATP-binding protein [Candidatus Omnitrophota bacterium]